MDIVIPTCGRELRLSATLSSIAAQLEGLFGRITILCNNGFSVSSSSVLRKILRAIEASGWTVDVAETRANTISTIKQEAIALSTDDLLMLVDEDVLFLKPGTVTALARGLEILSADAISPIGFEVDDDRPILNDFAVEYGCCEFKEGVYTEGRVALGMCILMTAAGREVALKHWCTDLPYMEDQIILHFIKKASNYLWCHSHPVVHLSSYEDQAYIFDDSEVVRYLETLCIERPEYGHLLELRRTASDGVAFRKVVTRRDTSTSLRGGR